jgi:streptogramin lyase
MNRRHANFGVWPASLLATVILASCADGARTSAWDATATTVGGVLHVVNTPPEAGPAPTLRAEEELRVGTLEGGGPASFGMIRDIAVLPDGRVAVADGQAEEVRLFGPDGRHLRTFGGEGAGPGELSGLQGVHLDHAGMLRVAEQGNARLSVFDPDTGFVTTYPLQLYSFGFRGPWRAAVDSVGRTFVASSGQYGENRYWNMVRVYDTTMIQLDSIPYHDYTDEDDQDEIPGAWRIELGSGSWTWALVPFYARPNDVLAPTGEFWSSAPGQSNLVVARWTPPADTSLVLTSRRTPDRVTNAERDSAMTELQERLAARIPSPRSLDASRVPDTKPPAYALSLDDAGRLWVRLTEPTADSTVYDVFGRDGRHAETVRLPFRVDAWIPPVVRRDTVWAVVTDEMDVQYVVRAVLRSPPRSERD